MIEDAPVPRGVDIHHKEARKVDAYESIQRQTLAYHEEKRIARAGKRPMERSNTPEKSSSSDRSSLLDAHRNAFREFEANHFKQRKSYAKGVQDQDQPEKEAEKALLRDPFEQKARQAMCRAQLEKEAQQATLCDQLDQSSASKTHTSDENENTDSDGDDIFQEAFEHITADMPAVT